MSVHSIAHTVNFEVQSNRSDPIRSLKSKKERKLDRHDKIERNIIIASCTTVRFLFLLVKVETTNNTAIYYHYEQSSTSNPQRVDQTPRRSPWPRFKP
jgi:hypothetical protein